MVSQTNFYLFPHLLLLISLHTNHSSAINSISFNHSLSGYQTITSNNGKFVMGFCQLNEGNPLSYIGIWYKTDSWPQHVWIANRETPVTDTTSSKLKIADDGNLVLIIDQSRAQIWSTNLTRITSNWTVAVIQDSGNLVLRDGSDPKTVLWDSCDHPTDTWLPGCYLGLNKVTGENRRLTSWKSSSNPSPGLFSLEMESDEPFIKWNSSYPVWSSRNWVSELSMSISEYYNSPIVKFKHVSSAAVNYFTYSLENNSYGSIVVFTMSYSGKIVKMLLDGDQSVLLDVRPDSAFQCGPYPFCGPFGNCLGRDETPHCQCPLGFHSTSQEDQSKGCVRDAPLLCGTDDVFSWRVMNTLSHYGYATPADSARSCELACRNNCSCTAYSFYDSLCSVWYGDLLTHSSYDGSTLYLRLGPTDLTASNKNNKGVSWIIMGAILSSATCMVVILLIIRRYRRRDTVHKMKMAEGTIVPFRYSELKQITKDFSEKLGGGGFGSVFKGTLPNFNVVAIKKLGGILQGEKQFRSEVSTIGVIHHVNLVRLYGFCAEGPNKLLVYEYMPNGSLDFHLFRSTSAVLDWKMRYQIALGTARGLCYLHEKCRDCIIHCDIKPDNILLDASFVPKVADFGLAKIVGREFSTVLTTMRGTIGYLAPEWISGGSITSKADVFSYGMMLLEIISGRRNTKLIDNMHFFPLLAANKVLEGDVLSLLDPRLDGDANLAELDRVCKVACWCIQDNEDCRLSMGQVVQILEGIAEVNVPPISRLLQFFAENIESII